MRPPSLGFALLILLVGAVAPGAAGPAHADGGAAALDDDGAVAAQEGPDRPRTTIHIYVKRDGSARWTIVTRYSLSTDNETAAFRRMVDRLDRRGAERDEDVQAFRRFAAGASEATGREMNITDVSYDGTVADGMGRLNLSFRWTNFSNVSGDAIRLGDAFGTGENGEATWFSSLGADQRLVVHPPRGYHSESQRKFDTDGGTHYIEGPARFGTSPPSISYQRNESLLSEIDSTLFGGSVVVAVLLLIGAYLLRRRDADISALTSDGGWLLGASDRDADGEWTPPVGAGTTDGAAGADAASAAAAAGPEVAPEPDGADDGGDDVDLSLLSDGERVERIIERNGGRMRQADIVAETGWSDAKVSQLLSRLADEGRVEKLRLGRENLISLPDGDGRDG